MPIKESCFTFMLRSFITSSCSFTQYPSLSQTPVEPPEAAVTGTNDHQLHEKVRVEMELLSLNLKKKICKESHFHVFSITSFLPSERVSYLKESETSK